MNKAANVVVVIPVHSAQPTANELIAFEQCFRVLHGRTIKVLAPQGLELHAYRNHVADFDVLFIDPKWQASIAAYNKLKLSKYFYKLFRRYNYLLTYELDCFIFRDELDYWCSQGYDYIGAPWFEGLSNAKPDAAIVGVGNSGFSLRNIQTARRILNKIYYQNPLHSPSSGIGTGIAYIRAAYRWLRNQFGENYTLKSAGDIHEDFFFSKLAPQYFHDFKLPLVTEALKFSFEINPQVLLVMNNGNLPMGCHAWQRYDMHFWKPYIEKFGYNIK
ncbi:DUF5672 family protein [Hymenobacter sp. YC55]|uniref:DUF5672 family protein n=1 Tax=Hymenobacter sp. YC55 TaxID=3034019 RepID=UPI0023F87C7D|nr:DUF5672 family protein [Hymenobacter sp. YC55]MDF7810192.1 DUF5672 family protein [Hymenobacter sp. YC55]